MTAGTPGAAPPPPLFRQVHFAGFRFPLGVHSLSLFRHCGVTHVLAASRHDLVALSFAKGVPGLAPLLSGSPHALTAVAAVTRADGGVSIGAVAITEDSHAASDPSPHRAALLVVGIRPGAPLGGADPPAIHALPLGFTPVSLTSVRVVHQAAPKTILVAGGSDSRLHAFALGEAGATELPRDPAVLPEFDDLGSPVLCLDVRYRFSQRLSAAGCADGSLRVAAMRMLNRPGPGGDCTNIAWKLVQSRTIVLDGPVSAVRLFSRAGHPRADTNPTELTLLEQLDVAHVPLSGADPPAGSLPAGVARGAQRTNESEDINVLVGGALGYALAFVEFPVHGLGKPLLLPDSGGQDAVTCVAAWDADGDGSSELLYGAYGQTLTGCRLAEAPGEDGVRRYAAVRAPGLDANLGDPIMAVRVADVLGDGEDQLIVATLKGIHVLKRRIAPKPAAPPAAAASLTGTGISSSQPPPIPLSTAPAAGAASIGAASATAALTKSQINK